MSPRAPILLNRRCFLAAAVAAGVSTHSFAEAPAKILLLSGQSLASLWRQKPGEAPNSAQRAFRDTRRRMGDLSEWNFVFTSWGGSAAIEDYAARDSDAWWISRSLNKKGPALIRASDRLSSLPVSERPTHVVWSQGQREALVINDGLSTEDKRSFVHRYAIAITKATQIQRQAIAGDDWPSIPTYIQIIGRQDDGSDIGEDWVRAAQYHAIEKYGADFNLHPGAIEPLILPLTDYVHPTEDGMAMIGILTAQAIGFDVV